MSLFSLVLLLAGLQATSAVVTTPSGSYSPVFAQCPNTSLVRPSAQGLSAEEQTWWSRRAPQVVSSLEAYLNLAAIPGFNVSSYIGALRSNATKTPIIALSISGGGERSNLIGLGMYNALDSRNPDAVRAKTGGLAQTFGYITGASGGTIATTLLGVQDVASFETLLRQGNFNLTGPESAYPELFQKLSVGVNLTLETYSIGITSNQSIDPLSVTFSGVTQNAGYLNGSSPLPILALNEVYSNGPSYVGPNGTVLFPPFNSTTATQYEVSPIEWGSWQGRASAFASTKWLGSPLNAGQPVNSSQCVLGFDTATFVSGSALVAANLYLVQQYTNGTQGGFAKRDLVPRQQSSTTGSAFVPYPSNEVQLEQQRVLAINYNFTNYELPAILNEVLNTTPTTPATLQSTLYASWPNAFAGYSASDVSLQQQSSVQFVDGTESGNLNPVWPVIQKARQADFIIVSDNGGTELSSGWMNGSSLQISSATARAQGLAFPVIPPPTTMINLGYTTKPTYFGCNETAAPLVLYVADFPYSSFNNISYFATGFTDKQIRGIASNPFAAISQDNNRLTANWTTCLACGPIYKSIQRLNQSIPAACQQCMRDHCWNGTIVNSAPSFLNPSTLLVNSSITYPIWESTVLNGNATVNGYGSSSGPSSGSNATTVGAAAQVSSASSLQGLSAIGLLGLSLFAILL